MVHALTLRKGYLAHTYGHKAQERFKYILESWFVLGSILFVIGSAYFIDDLNITSLRIGCLLYDVGSVMFALGAFASLLDALWSHDWRDKSWFALICTCLTKEIGDQLFYFLGSVVFLMGTLMWDPYVQPTLREWGGTEVQWGQAADVVFMIGSFMFAFASFLTAFSIHEQHQLFQATSVLIISCYEFGGWFFIAGTMAYMPGFNCDSRLPMTGGIMFLIGSSLYTIGCSLSLFMTVGTYQAAKEHWTAAEKLQGAWRSNRAKQNFNNALRGVSGSSYSTQSPSPSSLQGYLTDSVTLSPASVSVDQQTRPVLNASPNALKNAYEAMLRMRLLTDQKRREERFELHFNSISPNGADADTTDCESSSREDEGVNFGCMCNAPPPNNDHEMQLDMDLRSVLARAWQRKCANKREASTSPRQRWNNENTVASHCRSSE